MNRFDLDSAALRLSAELHQEGLPGWAGRVMEATSFGTTGAEVSLALRSVLQRLLRSESSCRPRTLQIVQELLHSMEPVMA